MRRCAQCDGPIPDDRTSRARYCSDRCRWDHGHGRPAELSRNRRQTGFGWPPPNQPRPVRVTVPRAKVRRGDYPTCVLILPDIQYGWWRTHDGEMIPVHDPDAINTAVAVAEHLRPDGIVQLGDLLDLPEFGRYIQEPGFAETTQAALDAAYQDVARFRALCQWMVVLEGNHDARIQNAIIENAKAAAGVKRAAPTPDEWPVLTLPHLLRFDELDVEYVDGYPVSVRYLNDLLAVKHGQTLGNRTRGQTQLEADEERVSVIVGHSHKAAVTYKTRNERHRFRQTFAYSPGTLAAIDGRVPGVKQGLNRRTGRPRRSWQDWQQGVGVVHLDGDEYHVEHVPIVDGVALFRDLRIAA